MSAGGLLPAPSTWGRSAAWSTVEARLVNGTRRTSSRAGHCVAPASPSLAGAAFFPSREMPGTGLSLSDRECRGSCAAE